MSENSSKAKPGQYLTFQLQTEQYGLPIETVREINQYGEITPVPRSPDYVKGVMNLRGKIIPVVNLRIKFGMDSQTTTRDTCIIVIETEIGQVGMIVDSVKEVVDLLPDQIEPAPSLGNNQAMAFVRGMGKVDNRVVILVDIVSAFTVEQMNAISVASEAEAA